MLTDTEMARLERLAEAADHTKSDRPSYSSKPDPEEPWRYACPDCESVAVERISGGKRRKGITYRVGGGGVKAAAADRQLTFRCMTCNKRKPTLYDRKRGREVPAVE